MKKLEEKVAAFAEKHSLEHSHETALIDLVSEVGEVAKEMLKSTDYGTTEFDTTEAIINEIGDVYYSLIMLASALNIDLEEALDIALDKYKERLSRKNNAGSK